MNKDSTIPNIQQADFWVVIPAAGIGNRMDSAIPKQYILIDGFPVLSHTISQFLQHPKIKGVMVVIAAEDSNWQMITDAFKEKNTIENSNPNLRCCIGGKTRMDSVLAGLNALADDINPNQWVLVHDAARPGITQTTLNNFITQFYSDTKADGYVLAQLTTDTLKFTNSNGDIESTLDRTKIWSAQTPQAFKYRELQQCLDTSQRQKENAISFTDESSAMETDYNNIKVIPGNSGNFKITTADDINRMAFEIGQQLNQAERVHPKQFFQSEFELKEGV